MKHTIAFVVTVFLAAVGATCSFAGEWTVERVSGKVWTVSWNETRQQLKADMKLPRGATVVTSSNGRTRISNGRSVMTLAPNSVASVEQRGWFVSRTRVAQRAGKITFDVEKRQRPHFKIETPYLAAVVKGTTFTVTVTRSRASVDVKGGLVGVTDLQSGQTADVGAGQRASSTAQGHGLTTGGKTAPAVSQAKASAPTVAPLGRTLAGFKEDRAANETTSSVDGKAGKSNTAGGSNAGGNGKGGSGGSNGGNGNSGGNGNGGSGGRDGNGGGNGNDSGNGNGSAGGRDGSGGSGGGSGGKGNGHGNGGGNKG